MAGVCVVNRHLTSKLPIDILRVSTDCLAHRIGNLSIPGQFYQPSQGESLLTLESLSLNQPTQQQESFFEGLATIFFYARIPHSLVVRKMQRVFREAGGLTSITEIVFRTSYNRPFDEEANPEGLEHRGSDFQTKWDKCIDDIGWWYCSNGPCTVLVGIGAVL